MIHLKTRGQIVEQKLGLVNEVATKTVDGYQVITPIIVPKSLINAFVSKAKKENGIDPRETFGDALIAELLVNYVAATFLNIESIPVTGVLGEKSTGEVQTTIQPEELVQTPPAQAQIVQPGQPAVQTQEVPTVQGQPTAEIQQEKKINEDAENTPEIKVGDVYTMLMNNHSDQPVKVKITSIAAPDKSGKKIIHVTSEEAKYGANVGDPFQVYSEALTPLNAITATV